MTDDETSSTANNTPANPDVVNKYQTAGEIANKALLFAISQCKIDGNIADICRQVDEHIVGLAGKVYKGASIAKGIAFPCAISVNHVLCHYAPIPEDASVLLKKGDLVKIELGAHIDGFPALVAHSLVIGAGKEGPVTGKAANVIQTAYLAAEAALRLIRRDALNTDIPKPMQEIAEALGGTRFIEGMISHSVAKDLLASGKALVINPTDTQAKSIQPFRFDLYDVFVIDIAVSAGEGKVRPLGDCRTSIYCKTGSQYALKLKTSRAVFSEIQSKFGSMAFNIRSLDDQVRSRMALKECAQHNLVNPYEVLAEIDEQVPTARFMFTMIMMPSGPLKITSFPFEQEYIQPDQHSLPEHIQELLSRPIRKKK